MDQATVKIYPICNSSSKMNFSLCHMEQSSFPSKDGLTEHEAYRRMREMTSAQPLFMEGVGHTDKYCMVIYNILDSLIFRFIPLFLYYT